MRNLYSHTINSAPYDTGDGDNTQGGEIFRVGFLDNGGEGHTASDASVITGEHSK